MVFIIKNLKKDVLELSISFPSVRAEPSAFLLMSARNPHGTAFGEIPWFDEKCKIRRCDWPGKMRSFACAQYELPGYGFLVSQSQRRISTFSSNHGISPISDSNNQKSDKRFFFPASGVSRREALYPFNSLFGRMSSGCGAASCPQIAKPSL